MVLDMHFHLAGKEVPDVDSGVRTRGCVVSKCQAQNTSCLEFSSRTGAACALYADPFTDELTDIIHLVAKKRVFSYNHLERVGYSELNRFDRLLELSASVGIAAVLHLSHHGSERFKMSEADACLDHVSRRFPNLTVIISHLGGENCACALSYARALQNMYLDTSRLRETTARLGFSSPTETLRLISDALPVTRLLYGSDLTWPDNQYDRAESEVFGHFFSAHEVDGILHSNASSILSRLQEAE